MIMKRYKYLTYPAGSISQEMLNLLGQEGWELVTIHLGCPIFKQPIVEDDTKALDCNISIYKLDARCRDVLKRAQCTTYRDLVKVGRHDILCYTGFGKKSLHLIDELMEEEGFADYWFGYTQLKQ